MGRIDDAIRMLEATEDGTERALQLAGLISTLFKIKGVVLIVTGQLAYDSYANTASEPAEVELAPFAGDLAPRTILEIMRGHLYGKGSLYQWTVAGTPVRFHHDVVVANRELCRDITTEHGVVKLLPVEEITADNILAAVYPESDADAEDRARLLLINALAEAFLMDWTALQALCHRPEYRVGEELAQMRQAAKKEVDAMGASRDHIGQTTVLPNVGAAMPSEEPVSQEEKPAIPLSAPEEAVGTLASGNEPTINELPSS